MNKRPVFYALIGLAAVLVSTAVLSGTIATRAATIDISGTVSNNCGNGVRETGEVCDGSDGSGNCYNNTCKADCSCPVCGNNTIEAGETCESSSQCTDGRVCQSCNCVSIPTACVPSQLVCAWGPCVDGVQSGACSNGCSVTTVSQSCTPPPVCGDGQINPGEECDDGNIVSGDNCSATCQLEVGCGNGRRDPREQCDDNNVVSGDCCSSSCVQEVFIRDVAELSSSASAVVSWQTPCRKTISNLSWGKTPALGGGSVSGLTGQTYSYTITGLQPNTVYYYTIRSRGGSLLDVYSGSFLTTGGVELCTNGLDDDHDGFCDYPAAVCFDESVSGDPDCACTADFACTPGACDANNQWTVTCADQSVPRCETNYQYQETCNICPGVVCGSCEQLNEQTCTCEPTANCCGNGSCEPPGEDPYICQLDCPTDCLSDWDCGDWQPISCPAGGGIQTRSCVDRNACAVPINSPATQQTCGGICSGLTCGADQTIDINRCACVDIVPYCGNGVCESGESHATCVQDCVEPCTPNWTCIQWGECTAGVQSRDCYDLNNCNLNIDRPPETRSCTPGCEVACTMCQNINIVTCACQPKTPCCGNRICEAEETTWSCATDCGVPPTVSITLTACLDGLDNDNDGLVDYPLDPGCAKPWDKSELSTLEVLANVQNFLAKNVIDNPIIEALNQTVGTPALAVAIAVNTVTTFSFFNFAAYLRYFFTQPVAVVFRRRRRKWGVVYNSLTKQPVDLAIVRLYGRDTNRLIQSRVTDRLGRFSFLVTPGLYYLTVTKPTFAFPSQYLKDKKEDAKYLDLYHGENITVTNGRADITVNIPIDSSAKEQPATRIIIIHYLRKLQYWLAFSGVPLAVIAAIISPSILTFVLIPFHCLMFVLFRRLGYQSPPKNWGIVYDQKTRKPLGRAIARIYDKQYNKLLETRVTDDHGRYAFLVDQSVYYVTAEKNGYEPVKTDTIDLVAKQREALVDIDIGLPRASETIIKTAEIASSAVDTSATGKPAVNPSAPSVTPVASTSGVGREALEKLITSKDESMPRLTEEVPVVEPPLAVLKKIIEPSESESATPVPSESAVPKPPMPDQPSEPSTVQPPESPKNIFG